LFVPPTNFKNTKQTNPTPKTQIPDQEIANSSCIILSPYLTMLFHRKKKRGGHILSFIRQGPDHTKQATVEERNHHREDEHKASNIEPRLPSPVSESMFNPA
jgi:hypothetical protein